MENNTNVKYKSLAKRRLVSYSIYKSIDAKLSWKYWKVYFVFDNCITEPIDKKFQGCINYVQHNFPSSAECQIRLSS